jgi:signal transduction histidine kinase
MGEMISMIAHQWRQPLSAISATSSAIHLKAQLDKLDKQTSLELSDKISQYSQHLSHTIDDFRNFFKKDKEKTALTYDTIVKSAISIVASTLENQNIKLNIELQATQKISIMENELKQVVLNLIKNAEDILTEKEIQNPFITIRTYEDDTYAYLEVNDNGGGIPQEILPKVFDPYFSTKTKKDGTGLGLYMSKTIIEDHCDGRLSVTNNEYGALFRIEIPLCNNE